MCHEFPSGDESVAVVTALTEALRAAKNVAVQSAVLSALVALAVCGTAAFARVVALGAPRLAPSLRRMLHELHSGRRNDEALSEEGSASGALVSPVEARETANLPAERTGSVGEKLALLIRVLR
uniref:Uncharacterized protein n=1 Tax=Neobodo designis TaxID=312471 RepID=A0A7S1PPE2_NEODS